MVGTHAYVWINHPNFFGLAVDANQRVSSMISMLAINNRFSVMGGI